LLTSHIDQEFYVKDERNPDWVCAVRTKPRNVYGFGLDEESHDVGALYHECEPLVLTNGNLCDMNDEFKHDRPDIDPIETPVE
jgi:hypothetical protein